MTQRIPTKIIQISTMCIHEEGRQLQITALCEDGSVWCMFSDNGGMGWYDWELLSVGHEEMTQNIQKAKAKKSK